MSYNLNDPKDHADVTDLVGTLERISTVDPTTPVQGSGLDDQTLGFLQDNPAALEELTQAWATLGASFPAVTLSPQQRQRFGAAPLPSLDGWIRATADALAPHPRLQQAAGISAARLGDLVDFDPLLGTIRAFAAKARNGGMDLRALLATYAWFAICLVVETLRRRVRTVPRDQANALLADFGPMLLLIARAQEKRTEAAQAARARRAEAEAQAQAAEAEATRAETLHAFHAGQPVPDKDLLDAIQKPQAPAAPRQRTRRARSGRKTHRT